MYVRLQERTIDLFQFRSQLGLSSKNSIDPQWNSCMESMCPLLGRKQGSGTTDPAVLFSFFVVRSASVPLPHTYTVSSLFLSIALVSW